MHGLSVHLRSKGVWYYSLAIDDATHRGRAYIDERVRLIIRGYRRNYHLLAIPLSQSHTGKNMYEVARDVLLDVGDRL